MFRAALSNSSTVLSIRLIVEYRASGRFVSLLVPNPRIDHGVHEIGNQIREDDADDYDHTNRFIHQEPWRASEKPLSPGFQDLPQALPQRMWQFKI